MNKEKLEIRARQMRADLNETWKLFNVKEDPGRREWESLAKAFSECITDFCDEVLGEEDD